MKTIIRRSLRSNVWTWRWQLHLPMALLTIELCNISKTLHLFCHNFCSLPSLFVGFPACCWLPSLSYWLPSLFVASQPVCFFLKFFLQSQTCQWFQSELDVPRLHLPDSQLYQDLAANTFWQVGRLCPLPWHDQEGQPLIGMPHFALHSSIVDALAPAMPLKAFSRMRRWRVISFVWLDFNLWFVMMVIIEICYNLIFSIEIHSPLHHQVLLMKK